MKISCFSRGTYLNEEDYQISFFLKSERNLSREMKITFALSHFY